MSSPITKADFRKTERAIDRKIDHKLDTAISIIRQDIKEFNQDVNKRLSTQDKKLDGLKDDMGIVKEDVAKIKLAVVDLMKTDTHLHNLVDELHDNNIDIDEAKVFAA